MEDCRVTENTATGNGGGLGSLGSSTTLLRCTFQKNTSNPSGGALYLQNEATRASIEGCQFTENIANNGTTGFGGAISTAFRAQSTLLRCSFQKNESGNVGGAVHVQNDSSKVSITECTFTENTATNNGGAVHLTGGPDLDIAKSTFSSNSGDFGGAVAVSGSQADPSVVTIDQCIFRENAATTQAGALNIDNVVRTRVTNSAFIGNIGENGAAISNNASARDTSRLTLIYCSIAGGISGGVPGIVQYEDRDSSKCILTLQNTIMSNMGDNYVIEKGKPTVISLGGNLSSDASLKTVLTGTNDLNETNPKFVDESNSNYALAPGSPCINKGVPVAGITTDLLGVPRGAQPDMGAFEFVPVSVFDRPEALRIEMTPNPATDMARLRIDDAVSGDVIAEFFDVTGKLVAQVRSEKAAGEWQLLQPVANWTAGVYQVRVRVGSTLYGGALVKE
jgi:predicted outer membrane repeat protein